MDITTIAGSCIVKGEKILLLQQSSEKYIHAGLWGPPAGHGEAGEKLLETAIRETKEECNLDVEAIGIVESGLFRASDNKNYLIVLYLCKAININELKTDGFENIDYKWASSEELISGRLKLRHPILLPILISAIKGQVRSLDTFKDVDIKV